MRAKNPVLPPARLALLLVVLVLLTLAFRDWRLLQTHALEDGPEAPAAGATTAPAAPPRAEVAALPLFGQAPAAASPSQGADGEHGDPAALPESTASYRLFGVLMAPAADARYALIGEGEDSQQAYREGDAAPDGARLKSVREGWVVLERNGQEERLSLTDAAGTGAPGADGLPPTEGQPGDFPAPASPAPSAAAERLQARIRARRAAAEARQPGPKND